MLRGPTFISIAFVLFIAGTIGALGGLALLPVYAIPNCVFNLSLASFFLGGLMLSVSI